MFAPGMQTKGITELLQAPGKLAGRIAGISGTRNLSDNLSDLKAQVVIRPAYGSEELLSLCFLDRSKQPCCVAAGGRQCAWYPARH